MGAPPGKERKREFVDNPNGLFSAQAAPKPPPAMYSVVQGMKVGGKVIFSPSVATHYLCLQFVSNCSSSSGFSCSVL